MKRFVWSILIAFGCLAVLALGAGADASPLRGLKICLDPGHGNTARTDSFRLGPGGEREEWVNLRVGMLLQDLLREAGAEVLMTRETDTDVNLAGRAALAKLNDCDLFVSIHHNGTSNDPEVDFPLIYFWGKASANPASVDLGRHVIRKMLEKMEFEGTEGAGLYSDFLIYPEGTAVLRNSYPELPGIIGEAGYFTNADAEARMKDPAHNRAEAEAYFEGIVDYASKGIPKAVPVEPKEGEFLSGSKPEILFQVSDGLDGHTFQENILAKGEHIIEQRWEPQSGQLRLRVEPGQQKEVTVTVWGRNTAGNALHPRQWTFKTAKSVLPGEIKTWRDAYERAERIYAKASHVEKNQDELLKEAIKWYETSLELHHHHPASASAELRIADCYKHLYIKFGEREAGQEARRYDERVSEYYPDSYAARHMDDLDKYNIQWY